MRIKVDFSEFFNDERKLSVVNVNTKESATVQDVLHKIIRMFKLTPTTPKRRGNVSSERLEYGLFEEEFYIPPEETSTVLEDIGILRLKSLSNIQTETPEGKKKKHKKIKVEEEEEVQPPESDDGDVGRKRRSKRHKVKVEEYSKEKKNKRRKEDVESDVDGKEEEDDDDGDSKKTRRQSLKKSRRSAPTVDADEVKKPKRKGRQPAESDEVEENNCPKKRKREVHQDSTSVTSAEELEDISSKEKKKSKRKGSKSDVTSAEIEGEGIRSGPINAAEARNKKCTRRSVIEDVKAPTVLKSVKVEKEEEKRSQEKEISTSNVIHVESDEGSESSFSGSSGSNETVDAGHVIGTCGLADSVSGEQNVTKRNKRRRKHAKAKKRARNMPEDVGVASQSNAFKIGEHTRMSTNPGARNNPSMNTRQRNINVSTSSDRFHVFFPSEEEEEVTSVTNSGDGKDIEILGQTSGPAKKHYSPCTVTQSSDKDLNSQSPACKQTIIDIEGEDSSQADPQNTGLSGGATDGIRRRYPQKSRVSFDDLSNLRRMCDMKNLTIVSVSSKKRTVTSMPVELACPVSHASRGPPCPVPSRNEMNECTRRIFNNLLSLENRGEPLILRTSRQIDLDVEEDVDCMGDTNFRSSVQMDAQSNLLFTQNPSMEDSAADPHDVLCMPSTSGYMETNGTPVDVPGPSTRTTRKGAPRSFRSLGEILSNLRNPQDPEEHELQVITGNEDILLDIPSSPEEIKQEKEDAASTNGGDDDDITSTIGIVEKQEFIVPDELSSLKGAADVAQNCDPMIDPLHIDDGEARALMEEMLAEGLKQDMLMEIMGTSIDEDTHFTKYPLMKILPKAGEFIAVKVLSLDENLRPVHSNYIKVQVVEVSGMMIKLKKIPENIKKKELKVKVEDGVEEVDLTFEEEVDLTEVDLTEDDQSDVLDLDWRDILEPRLLFP